MFWATSTKTGWLRKRKWVYTTANESYLLRLTAQPVLCHRWSGRVARTNIKCHNTFTCSLSCSAARVSLSVSASCTYNFEFSVCRFSNQVTVCARIVFPLFRCKLQWHFNQIYTQSWKPLYYWVGVVCYGQTSVFRKFSLQIECLPFWNFFSRNWVTISQNLEFNLYVCYA